MKPNTMQRFYLCVLTLLLSSCALRDTELENALELLADAERGYVLGRFETSCDPEIDSCELYFAQTAVIYNDMSNRPYAGVIEARRPGGRLTANNKYLRDPGIFDAYDLTDKTASFHFCVPLPPGSYSFTNVVWFESPFTYRLSTDENPVDLPFKVDSSSLSYVGVLRPLAKMGPPPRGFGEVPVPAGFELEPGSHEDLELAIRKCPAAVRERQLKHYDLLAKDSASFWPSFVNNDKSDDKQVVLQFNYKNIEGAIVDSELEISLAVKPGYPEELFNQGIEGQVTFEIGKIVDGRLSNIKIVNSSPAGVFDDAALTALSGWIVKPPRKNGDVVDVRYQGQFIWKKAKSEQP